MFLTPYLSNNSKPIIDGSYLTSLFELFMLFKLKENPINYSYGVITNNPTPATFL